MCALAIVLLGVATARPLCGQQAEPHGRFVNRTQVWERSYRNLLSGFCDMYNLRVLYEPGAAYPFKGWFFGWAVEDCNRNIPGNTGCDAIFHARAKSLDGPWEVYCGDGVWDGTMTPSRWRPVVSAQNRYYDQWHNGDPSVVKVRGRYFMAYSSTGFNKDGYPQADPRDTDGDILCVMGAASDDGIHWRRSSAPILMHKEDYGAPSVPKGVHPYGSYHRPSLLYENGVFKIWFDYWLPGKGIAMGYAENRGDFLTPESWRVVRAGDNPCLQEWPNPSVAHVGKTYYCYSDPGGYGKPGMQGRKIAEAVSSDGLKWEILGYVDPDPDSAATHVPEAFVWREGKTTWMYVFYACQIGGDPYNWRYDRIRCMRRKLPVKPEVQK
jgi:hypothetical protein